MVEKKKLIHEPYNKFKDLCGKTVSFIRILPNYSVSHRTTVSQKVNGQSDFTVSEQS